jgi:hypothetical protein
MSGAWFKPHEAARSYASAAAVLAGFCFAAVVLIVSLEQGAINLQASGQVDLALEPGDLDRAVGALLTAFLGLVLSSFLFARVGGQPEPVQRGFWSVLLASVGLATSALFALWGLSELIDVVLDRDEVHTLVRWVFVATSVLAASFVAAAACDRFGTEIEDAQRPWAMLLLVLTAALGGFCVFFLGLRLSGSPDLGSATPIDRIAKIQIVGFVIVVLAALGLSSTNGEDVPGWLRGWCGGVLTFLLVMLPPAVAIALFARLHE